MGQGSGMTRGDRRRNARRERLREMLPRDGAVIGIDLGDEKQAVAVIDHDVRVLARKTVRVKAFRLGEALEWAVGQARAKGFTAVAVACEPTGPRWLQVQRLCAERGLALVCVQPLVSHIARQQQDYTTHKTDLLTELPDVAAAQEARPSPRPIIGVSEKSRSPGRASHVASLNATETGHTVLNHFPSFSSLPIFDFSRGGP